MMERTGGQRHAGSLSLWCMSVCLCVWKHFWWLSCWENPLHSLILGFSNRLFAPPVMDNRRSSLSAICFCSSVSRQMSKISKKYINWVKTSETSLFITICFKNKDVSQNLNKYCMKKCCTLAGLNAHLKSSFGHLYYSSVYSECRAHCAGWSQSELNQENIMIQNIAWEPVQGGFYL